ncbi:MAG TPA: UDP-N-acetylmuramoyl-L-alanyl-D-glutamate--2,6-diaminopimelate ligase [Acidimicrobiales bacterium]|nr:UDP-N-acetylmuramoyl-L-alanyl-D-glutamate--2,6-diaminopimelate ligase [Acidimicrobiales bacterium]
MQLDRLLGGVEVLDLRGDPAGTEVTAITHDSRAVILGALFCCVPGALVDGHAFAADAVAAGASALLCERVLPLEVTQVVVPSVRAAMAPVAAAFFGHPSRRLAVVGVTGTNGKTTTTHLLAAALRADGRPTDVVGTLSGPRTTPEATELQARLAALADGGTAVVSMEVSSHALVQHRVDATWFEVGVFTNLSQDHLDYHGTLDEYFAAKASLFTPDRVGVAVVNADDAWGRRLLDAVSVPTRPFTLADAAGLNVGPVSSTFRWQGEPVHLRLGGSFNVANALAAATAALELGARPEAIAAGLSSVVSVPGRFETVEAGQPFTVVVDYAHTPASLEQVLLAARHAAADRGSAGDPGRVLLVFGCGGDRDTAKRPAMGEVASRLADLAVLTSDNPRSEDPAAIIEAVRQGVVRDEVLVVEPDRRAAIALAVGRARPGDVVIVAGKGHETTQVTGAVVEPFDDRAVVRAEIERTGR